MIKYLPGSSEYVYLEKIGKEAYETLQRAEEHYAEHKKIKAELKELRAEAKRLGVRLPPRQSRRP